MLVGDGGEGYVVDGDGALGDRKEAEEGGEEGGFAAVSGTGRISRLCIGYYEVGDSPSGSAADGYLLPGGD